MMTMAVVQQGAPFAGPVPSGRTARLHGFRRNQTLVTNGDALLLASSAAQDVEYH